MADEFAALVGQHGGKITQKYMQGLDKRITTDPAMKDGGCAGLVVSWICKSVTHDNAHFWEKMWQGLPKRVKLVMVDQGNYGLPLKAAVVALRAKSYLKGNGGDLLDLPDEWQTLEEKLVGPAHATLLQFTGHAMGCIQGNLFFDPNFGEVAFAKPSNIAPFLKSLLSYYASKGHSFDSVALSQFSGK
jgi:hypothetical protein